MGALSLDSAEGTELRSVPSKAAKSILIGYFLIYTLLKWGAIRNGNLAQRLGALIVPVAATFGVASMSFVTVLLALGFESGMIYFFDPQRGRYSVGQRMFFSAGTFVIMLIIALAAFFLVKATA